MPLRQDIKKVLVIGSGPIIIGQAAEFDYAGAQACTALKEEGLEVVLINSNPATIMTDKAMADHIYIEPLTLESVKRIIEIEKPDSLLSTLGGQTGLTLSMQLAKDGFLDKHNVKLLGANPETIDKAEDRQEFKDTMEKIGQPCIPSKVVENLEDAKAFAHEIGLPVIIRPAFTLGGTGGGIAETFEEFEEIATNGLRLSPITQILVEKCISGWKEIEFEVIRDSKSNVITVCSMENVDPVGVHTGDSIVVAPALTLSDREYQMLRTAALDIINELKVEGGCNCQFALHPESFDYAVIEVNPRVSRSSALASKATGYPIAKVATKIAIGYTLDEIVNQVTGSTYACFEPALDYVVVKFPKWPFDKFVYAKRKLGTQMKATGEVMSIGTTFEQAMMKSVRGIELGLDTLDLPEYQDKTDAEIEELLSQVDDRRIFVVYQAVKRGIPFERIHEITMFDEWFLAKLKNIAQIEEMLEHQELTDELYARAKDFGFLDSTIERLSGQKIQNKKTAVYKMVDTCAAEFKAQTPYFYSTYDEENEAEQFIERTNTGKKKVIVFGSGPIRIGQGIEFDYCSVHCVWTLKELGYEAIICNNNPETVSTDYNTGDRLYFDPVYIEDVANIIATEKPYGVVVQFGGQTAIKLTKKLQEMGVPILGTSADSIDAAEDRERFDEVLEKCGIPRPAGETVFTTEEALASADRLGYPVLLRPSYVLGGQNMIIAHSDKDIIEYMAIITSHEIENPVLVDKYMMGVEVEVDAICDGEDFLIPGIMEHIERAGVHSGDSISVYPAQNLSKSIQETIIDYTRKLALELKVYGLLNIQYVVYNGQVYVIEVNPRSSRTVPYISKVTNVPMVDLATKIMFGAKLKDLGYGTGLYPVGDYVAVKVPVFSFEKLHNVDIQLGPEMKSTGEVLGIAKTFEDALLKGLIAAGYEMGDRQDKKGVFITVRDSDKQEVVDVAEKFADMGYTLYATAGTASRLNNNMIPTNVVKKIHEDPEHNTMKLIESGKIDYVISTSAKGRIPARDSVKIRRKTVELSIPCLTSLDTANALADCLATHRTIQDVEMVDITKI
ncbi:carbamoyl-phosphate synthase large subunit [Massilioclostridium coli]|uniref:carbamoyl-phosphate synthase large subunit n=1 Tax=Massilioclostridium coli TaxID=1870991 RepID=UPI00085BDB36|nr:carbamoyl-phosphate synthase large subunit [Massilioclostridium coli]